MIPRILIRTVPTNTTDEVEDLWRTATALHPGWTTLTLRDPIDPDVCPRSLELAGRCSSGAQFAGLVRLEVLLTHGGVYIDSDFECYRSFEPLLGLAGFAGWEDHGVVPDAVLGFEPAHPALEECWLRAVELLDQGAWASGPGVTTEVLPKWPGVVLFPPAMLYPYHWTERARRHEDHRAANPWSFGAHHWAASWQKIGVR